MDTYTFQLEPDGKKYIFEISPATEGGFCADCINLENEDFICTQSETLEELKQQIEDAVREYIEIPPQKKPRVSELFF